MHSLPCRLAFAAFLTTTLVAQVEVGKDAPDVVFSAVLQTPAPIVSLADVRGSAVLLEFWATWCGPCRAQIPHLNALHAQYADRGLVVLGSNLGEKQAAVDAFIKANNMAYAIGFDDGAAKKAYGVVGIPHAVLIDPDGVLVWAGHPGKLAAADVERALAGARPFGLRLTDQLEPVQMLLDQEQKSRALALLLVLQKGNKLDARANELAAATIDRLQREAKRSLETATKLTAEGRLVAAAAQLLGVIDQFDGHDAAAEATAQLTKLEAIAAGKSALALARRLAHARGLGRSGKLDEARAEYEGVAAAGDGAAKELAERGLASLAASRAREQGKGK
jgi:thiol-disulfide isomerase/thioredoxin